MAWEWVAPTATAVVGVAGMWFTYRTGKKARETQAESERRALDEARRRDLTSRRQDVYGRFIAAVRELHILTVYRDSIDSVLGDRANKVDAVSLESVVRQHVPQVAQLELSRDDVLEMIDRAIAGRRDQFRAAHGVVDPRAWSERFSKIAALHAQVTLLAEPNVVEAAKSLMDRLPSTYASVGQRSDDTEEDVRQIAELTRQLVAAMAAEIRSQRR